MSRRVADSLLSPTSLDILNQLRVYLILSLHQTTTLLNILSPHQSLSSRIQPVVAKLPKASTTSLLAMSRISPSPYFSTAEIIAPTNRVIPTTATSLLASAIMRRHLHLHKHCLQFLLERLLNHDRTNPSIRCKGPSIC